MIRKLLFIIILITSFYASFAQDNYKAKKDSIPLRSTDSRILIELKDKNIGWLSTMTLNKRINVFYGSDDQDSTIYVSTIKSKLQLLASDTLTNCKNFQSSFSSSVTPTLRKGSERYPLFIYSYNAPFMSYIYDKLLIANKGLKDIDKYFTSKNRIINIVADDRVTRAFYIDNRFNKGVIMCIESPNGGISWNYPKISISDNILSFQDGSMTIDRKGILYLILTDTHNNAFMCKSENSGITWSYPEKLAPHFFGSNHTITINRSGVYISFLCQSNCINKGDYVVWNGSINELNKGASNGQIGLLLEKEYVKQYKIGHIKIAHLSGNKYLVSGIIEYDNKKIIGSFLFKGRFYL
ncbi:MAG: hypothetical protein RR132_00340 [Rikenellaceae bacterium]